MYNVSTSSTIWGGLYRKAYSSQCAACSPWKSCRVPTPFHISCTAPFWVIWVIVDGWKNKFCIFIPETLLPTIRYINNNPYSYEYYLVRKVLPAVYRHSSRNVFFEGAAIVPIGVEAERVRSGRMCNRTYRRKTLPWPRWLQHWRGEHRLARCAVKSVEG